MTKKIIGSGGLFGGNNRNRKPTREPDTLNSRQFATIQDLLSEGEIEGFATPSKASLSRGTEVYNTASLKDIILSNTPILSSSANNTNPDNADFNFQNVELTPRFGTASQNHIPGIVGSQSSTSVGAEVTASGGGVTRQITNTQVDAARITVTFPAIQRSTDEGDILGSSVSLKIQVQYNGGGFTDVLSDTVKGRTADPYQKDYRVDFTGAFPIDVKVVRLTADATPGGLLVDAFNWTVLTEIIDDKQDYPNSAYMNLRLDSEQFSSIPSRAFRIRGIKTRIPGAGASNSGTPSVDLQTGRIIYPTGYIFNGTMGAAVWNSCPSMALLDLLTTERYGLGTHISDNDIDLFSFIEASKYSNELVSDGQGGQEARFSCNVNIQGSKEAFNIINDIAGIMRAYPIWSAGKISLAQDRPTDPTYLFSLANVQEGGFSYSGSSLKQRNTVISVSYFDMDSREIDYEVVEDTSAQSKLGIIKKDVRGFGITSRGQAQRLGKAILFSEQQESEIITFKVSMDAGAIVRPGQVILINDPVKSAERRSGRINSATTTQITIDSNDDLDTFTGSNKKCTVILPDGSIQTKTVIGLVGNVITLDSALSQVPNSNSLWLLESSNLEPQTFRVISVEEQEGISYVISGLTYIAGKYANIEQGISLPTRNISLLNVLRDPPSNVSANELTVVINAVARTKLLISWTSVTGVSQYLVQYRFNNSNWVSQTVLRTDFEVLDTTAGTYEIKVYSFNAALELSTTSTDISFNAVGKTAPPENVQNLTLEPVTNKIVRLRWSESTDADVIHGGKVYVRHSNKTDGTGTFQNSVDLIEALAGNTTEAVVPSLDGEYILKFRDDQGNFSTGETSVILDLPDLIDSQQILADREDTDSTPFGGTKTNCTVASGALQLTDPSSNLTATYDFANTIDLGGVFSLNLKRLIQSIGFTVGFANTIDALIPSGTFWDDYAQNGNFDGPAINDVSASISVRTTQDNPSSGSPTYTQFNTFANGTYKGRGFQFRTNIKSDSIAHNISIQQLGIFAAFESRTERSYVSGGTTTTAPLSSGTSSSGLDVTFGSPFFVGTSSLGGANAFLPSVGITIIGASSGDYFELSNVSGTGFNIKVKNGTNFINKQFTFQAVGYGKGG
jgi:predicted phage tail protein